MIENIIAYGTSTMFFQIIQTNNMVQLLKIIKNKNSPTNAQSRLSTHVGSFSLATSGASHSSSGACSSIMAFLPTKTAQWPWLMLCPFVHFISKSGCSWSTFSMAQLDIRIQDREIRLILMYTVLNHAKSRCIASNLFFQIVAAIDISHCRDALIFTHGNDM